MLAQLGDGRGGLDGDNIGHQALVARGCLLRDDHALPDAGMSVEGGFDLAQLDPESADLDLVIHPAEVFHLAVGVDPRQVAAPVKPGAGFVRERVGQKAPAGQLGPVQVTPGHPGSSDADFAGCSRAHRFEFVIHQVEAQVGNGHPNDAAHAVGQIRFPDDAVSRVYRGFRDAVFVDDLRLLVAVAVEPRFQTLQFQRFAGTDHITQTQFVPNGRLRLGPDQLAERRGRLI